MTRMTRTEFIEAIGQKVMYNLEMKNRAQCWKPGTPGKLIWCAKEDIELKHIGQTVTAVAFADTPRGDFNEWDII